MDGVVVRRRCPTTSTIDQNCFYTFNRSARIGSDQIESNRIVTYIVCLFVCSHIYFRWTMFCWCVRVCLRVNVCWWRRKSERSFNLTTIKQDRCCYCWCRIINIHTSTCIHTYVCMNVCLMCTHAYQHTNIHIYINTYCCVVSECVKETDLYFVIVVAVIDDEKVARKARFPQFKYNKNNNSTNLRSLVVFVGVVITSLFL